MIYDNILILKRNYIEILSEEKEVNNVSTSDQIFTEKNEKYIFQKAIFESYLPNSFWFYYGAGQVYCKSAQRLLQIWEDLLQIKRVFKNRVTNYKLVHNTLLKPTLIINIQKFRRANAYNFETLVVLGIVLGNYNG